MEVAVETLTDSNPVGELIHRILEDLPSHEVGEYVPAEWVTDFLLDLLNASKDEAKGLVTN